MTNMAPPTRADITALGLVLLSGNVEALMVPHMCAFDYQGSL